MDNLRTPDDWYKMGDSIFHDALRLLSRYGVRTHPDLRFVRIDAPTPFYEAASHTIGFSIPDPATPGGRLYYYLIQHLTGAPNLHETERAIETTLPWMVTHELAHHLRHHYGAPVTNDFIEEQVANCIAVALLDEDERYQPGLPALRNWANDVYTRIRALAPDAWAYLQGFRLEIGDVLVSQGVLTPSALKEARRLADVTGVPAEDVLVRSLIVTPDQVDRARAEQDTTEEYFNRRYMAGLREYWLFGTEWLSRYLDRDDLPSLGEALGRYILTDDWEASQRDATSLLLEQALGSNDAAIASTAASSLAEHAGAAAVAPLVASLDSPHPSVRSAALEALGSLPGGPAAAAVKAQAMLERGDEASRHSARLLKRAGVPLPNIQSDSPVIRAGLALARLPQDLSAYEELARLLDSDEPSILAALDALRETELASLTDRVVLLLEHGCPAVREAAARALHRPNRAIPALVDLLNDDDPGVRQAAREILSRLDHPAWLELEHVLPRIPSGLAIEVLTHLDRDAVPEALQSLRALAGEMLECSRQMETIEARSIVHPGFGILAQAAAEERQRCARLSLRATVHGLDPDALSLIEAALDSPDTGHQASGRELVRASLGDRGTMLARLLETATPVATHVDASHVLGECARATSATIRMLAAYLSHGALAPGQTRGVLERLAKDPDPLVREEAALAFQRMDSQPERAMLTTAEKLMFLRSVPTFADCSVETLRQLARCCVIQQFEAGEVILREGETGQHFYIVTDGHITITVNEHQIDALGPRDYFGEMALFDGGPRSATATARVATTLLRLDRDDFHRLGRTSPELLLGVIRVLSQRLRAHMARSGQTIGQDPATRTDRNASSASKG